jgi:hypothetical protein
MTATAPEQHSPNPNNNHTTNKRNNNNNNNSNSPGRRGTSVPTTGKKKSKRKKAKNTDGIRMETFNAQGAFTGRRSFYPHLPGLESFIESELPEIKKTEESVDLHTTDPTMNHVGLLRRFTVNVRIIISPLFF